MHTITHWLTHQLWLTWHQVQTDITVPRIITGIIGYGLIHSGWSFINREKITIEKRRHTALMHIKKRHDGRFSHCEECQVTLRHYLTQPPLDR